MKRTLSVKPSAVAAFQWFRGTAGGKWGLVFSKACDTVCPAVHSPGGKSLRVP